MPMALPLPVDATSEAYFLGEGMGGFGMGLRYIGNIEHLRPTADGGKKSSWTIRRLLQKQ